MVAPWSAPLAVLASGELPGAGPLASEGSNGNTRFALRFSSASGSEVRPRRGPGGPKIALLE